MNADGRMNTGDRTGAGVRMNAGGRTSARGRTGAGVPSDAGAHRPGSRQRTAGNG